jgi:hypothetical protein
MKTPTERDKSQVDLVSLAKRIIETNKNQNNKSCTEEQWLLWLKRDDVILFTHNEKGFEDWTCSDYANNMSLNDGHGQPYAFIVDDVVIMHDYI